MVHYTLFLPIIKLLFRDLCTWFSDPRNCSVTSDLVSRDLPKTRNRKEIGAMLQMMLELLLCFSSYVRQGPLYPNIYFPKPPKTRNYKRIEQCYKRCSSFCFALLLFSQIKFSAVNLTSVSKASTASKDILPAKRD
jgi:hypothetical protein